MRTYETTTSDSRTRCSRGVLWFTAVVIAGFMPPALAVKPGNKGAQSTASVTISVQIHPSIKARHITPSTPALTSDTSLASGLKSNASLNQSDDYLCLDVRDTRTLTFLAITRGVDGSVMSPVAHWSHADDAVSDHVDEARCPIAVSLNLSRITPAVNGYTTLLVSPE